METFPLHLPIGMSTLTALVALIAGIWILVVPRALNYIVATYLLVVGGLGLLVILQTRHIAWESVVALVAGILILIKPRLLNYVVAFYLIAVGVLGLLRT